VEGILDAGGDEPGVWARTGGDTRVEDWTAVDMGNVANEFVVVKTFDNDVIKKSFDLLWTAAGVCVSSQFI